MWSYTRLFLSLFVNAWPGFSGGKRGDRQIAARSHRAYSPAAGTGTSRPHQEENLPAAKPPASEAWGAGRVMRACRCMHADDIKPHGHHHPRATRRRSRQLMSRTSLNTLSARASKLEWSGSGMANFIFIACSTKSLSNSR